ncbi:terminase small subunit [Mameliella alba]|nr:terminase small subunit [Mameliella alba]MBY6168495.1 terminase small subunit [Mameliella alba]MBY6173514.1 terminase small subunit [Mameliella alba]
MSDGGFDLEAAMRDHPLPEGIEDRVVNRKQCAQALNVSENIITKYLDQGLPVVSHGSNGQAYEFQLSEVYAWKMARDAELQRKRSEADRAAAQLALHFRGQDPDEDDARILSADEIIKESRADYERNKAAELRGELVRAARVRQMFEDVLIEFRTQIVSLVDFAEMEFGLSPEEVRKMQVRCDGTLVQARQSFALAVPQEVTNLTPHVALDEARDTGAAG